MKKSLFFILIIFILVGHLFSQTYVTFSSEIRQIKERARFKLGPFRIDPMIQLRNVGYDDNVYYTGEDDETTSDYTATISPEAKVYLLFRNYLILSLTENPEYVYYYRQSRERRWNHNISPAFRLLLFRRFIIGGSYFYQDRRYRATDEFDARRNHLRKGYRWSIFYETPRETSIGLSYQSAKSLHENAELVEQDILLSQALDRTEDQTEIEFYYKILSENFFFLKAGYTDYRFESDRSRSSDSYSYQSYTGIRFPLLGRMSGILSLGYKSIQLKTGDKKGFSGFVGNTNLQYRRRRFSIRFQFSRDSQFSFSAHNVYFIALRLRGRISFYLTRILRLDYGYTYGESHYPELESVELLDGSFESIKRKDIFRTQTIGLVYRLKGTTGIGLNATWWSRESNFWGVKRNRLFIGGYLTYDF